MKPLSARQKQVLQATVHHYVDTIEPVGSRTLVQRFGINASSATVRSAMGALEQRGLLTQPHTSAGRVPSPLGYRHYVDCLLPEPGVVVQHLERELTGLCLRWAALDDLLMQLTRRLTDFTGLMSLITRPAEPQAQLKAIRLVNSGDRLLVMLVVDSGHASHLNLRFPHGAEEELRAIERWTDQQLEEGGLNWDSLPPQLQRSGDVLRSALDHPSAATAADQQVVVHGLSRLVAEPEFQSSSDLRPLLELIDDRPTDLVSEGAQERVWIGDEHPHRALRPCSVVQAPYRCGSDGIGQVALVGPMRMAYSTAKAAVQRVAKHLELLLS
ncbi:MAG: heat-inducible transcription repressor HrcA [Cyanobium sp. NAT70]|nr:heat-inducible transcription repressor HrcA [Cyanobium sp. NAT70]|tara:strand:- start:72 stop:1052 length:981 start_codon:yes stop_codon:yes gene_type:complete